MGACPLTLIFSHMVTLNKSLFTALNSSNYTLRLSLTYWLTNKYFKELGAYMSSDTKGGRGSILKTITSHLEIKSAQIRYSRMQYFKTFEEEYHSQLE